MGDRVRAEPGHRLDKFTQWSRETIANNKRKSGTGSGKTIRNVLKGYSRDENFTQIENTTDIPFE